MKKFVCLFLSLAILLALAACGGGAPATPSGPGEQPGEGGEAVFPDALAGMSFVCDELETGEGTALYTLSFGEDGSYKLYESGGAGIVASGTASAGADKTLALEGGITGFYTSGGVFTQPSISLSYEGKEMEFSPANESSEYVYLSWLGVFGGSVGGESAVLIFDRWFEFCLLAGDTLVRGTFDIYADGRMQFSCYPSGSFTGRAERAFSGGAFDLTQTSFTVETDAGGLSGTGSFSYTEAEKTYTAAHAMGDYTLSVYDCGVFAIRGVSGVINAMGTFGEGADGVTAYFPRRIAGDAELSAGFNVAYTYDAGADSYTFPDNTPLLPRSGNIGTDGYGSYFVSGTPLEFIRTRERAPEDTTLFDLTGTVTGEGGAALAGVSVLVDGREASVTGEDGAFSVAGLAGERYVSFRAEGYLFDFYVADKNNSIIRAEGREGTLSENVPDTGAGMLNQTMPSVGTARPLVLLIDFPDQHRPRFVTKEGIYETMFDISNKDSLAAFYYRSSYGNLVIDGTVLDWYRAGKNRDSYASDTELMAEAMAYWAQTVDMSDYDADGDGIIDSLYILWAGTPDQNDQTWSSAYRSSWISSPEWNGVRADGYIFVPGSTVWSTVPPLACNINSLTHETGHLLGLNDYYSYDTSSRSGYSGGAAEGGMGAMVMMDSNIGDHNAYSKWLLGWLSPQTVYYKDIPAEGMTVTLRPSNEHADALFIRIGDPDTDYTELFVIESLTTALNGEELTRLKQPVVRVLHVEGTLGEAGLSGNWRAYGFRYDNSYTSTKFISVVEADGEDTVLNYFPASSGAKVSYDAGDYFLAGDAITPYTYPNTNGYDAYGNATVYTGISIEILSVAEDGTAEVRLSYAEEAEDALALESVSPEPTVVPYTRMATVPAGTAEFAFTFDRETEEAAEGALAAVIVRRNNQTLTDGYEVNVSGKTLTVRLSQGLAAREDLTVVLPRGIVRSAEDAALLNNFNSIFGFVAA